MKEKKIKHLLIRFDNEIKGEDVPLFRAAISEEVGSEHILFHNHHAGENKFRYAYPLIQYKLINKKIHILCLQQGVEEIHAFFAKNKQKLRIGNQMIEFNIENISIHEFIIQVWDKYFNYTMIRWLALNNENYEKYEKLESEIDKYQFLENILTANILAFAKGMGIQIEKEIKTQILSIDKEYFTEFKGLQKKAFSVSFRTNVFLPNYIGLGKSSSLGYGVIKEKKH